MKPGIFLDRTFFKFIIAGIINTVTGSAIMFTLYNAAYLGYWLSSTCNYVLTGILSFFLNKYFTFNVREWPVSMIVSFVLTIALSYLAAHGAARLVMNYFYKTVGGPSARTEHC